MKEREQEEEKEEEEERGQETLLFGKNNLGAAITSMSKGGSHSSGNWNSFAAWNLNYFSAPQQHISISI